MIHFCTLGERTSTINKYFFFVRRFGDGWNMFPLFSKLQFAPCLRAARKKQAAVPLTDFKPGLLLTRLSGDVERKWAVTSNREVFVPDLFVLRCCRRAGLSARNSGGLQNSIESLVLPRLENTALIWPGQNHASNGRTKNEENDRWKLKITGF